MIDWKQVQQLEDDVGSEDFAEVVALFLDEVEETLAPLRNPDTVDLDRIGEIMHFLKGSAYNLGFRAFGDFCSRGEELAKSGKAAEVDLPLTVSLYEQSKAEFLADASLHCSYTAAA
jgi:HPt (histidine-containing phosphotransfer) domain-containing protein